MWRTLMERYLAFYEHTPNAPLLEPSRKCLMQNLRCTQCSRGNMRSEWPITQRALGCAKVFWVTSISRTKIAIEVRSSFRRMQLMRNFCSMLAVPP